MGKESLGGGQHLSADLVASKVGGGLQQLQRRSVWSSQRVAAVRGSFAASQDCNQDPHASSFTTSSELD